MEPDQHVSVSTIDTCTRLQFRAWITCNALPTGKLCLLLVVCCIFFFKKNVRNTIRVSKSWMQIRPDTSGLSRFQTVCKGDQRTTLIGKELNAITYKGPAHELLSPTGDTLWDYMSQVWSGPSSFLIVCV